MKLYKKPLKKNRLYFNERAAMISNANSFLNSSFIQNAVTPDGRIDLGILRRNSMRGNATTLRTDDWKEMDSELVRVAKQRLVGIADLRAYGLVHRLGDLGVLLSQYEQVSDITAAEVSIGGESNSGEGGIDFTLKSVPVPIVHKDFRINFRTLMASQRQGEGIDLTGVALATRRVAEKCEDLLFNGSSLKVNTNTILGYTTATNRNTGTISNAWDGASGTPVDDALDMIKALRGDSHYGPYGIYVPKDYWAALQDDYKNESERTVLQRIMAIEGVAFVRVSDQIDNEVVAVSLTRDVVDLAIAQDFVTIPWQSPEGFSHHFKVMTAMVPRVKDDSTSQSGIAHWSE